MALSDLIDRAIEPFFPRTALRRRMERIALGEARAYEGAAHNRRTAGWRRTNGSADREVGSGLVTLRNGARELVRNDKLAAAAVRQITANMVGDGITAAATHRVKAVAKRAQAEWDRWCAGRVTADGRLDFYGVQKLVARSVIEGGECLIAWLPDENGPDGLIVGLEGDFLDHQKNDDRNSAGRIVQGVEFDAQGRRAAYWLLPAHPGDVGGFAGGPRRYDAANVDHVYEPLRWGQTRGVSWFAPVVMDIRDIGDVKDAVRMKKKVEACVSLVLTTENEAAPVGPFGEQKLVAGGPAMETLKPGSIYRARPGESATTLNPSSTGDGVDFLRSEAMGVSANLAPYHLISGDVSQANYSSLRACLLGFWANLDDWQQNMLVPFLLEPAFRRRMKRLALETGDRRYLEVQPQWAMPVRRFVDPIKDVAGEVAEVRAGFKSMTKALAERGRNLADHLAEIASDNATADNLGLALETDPRRVTQSGILQAASGYLAPRDGGQSN